jgi:small conductance mechanosensitive channel
MDLDLNKYVDLMIEWSLAYLPKVFAALIVLYIGFRLVGVLASLMHKALQHEMVDESLASFLGSIVSIGLKGLVLITVANMVGIQMTSFIALLGAMGLAVGLSLQGSLSNFAGGVLILLFKPFKVGDVILVNGNKGKVYSIQIANTILKTGDKRTIIIPNGVVSNGTIENFSTESTRRLDMVFGIGYADDFRQAKKILREIVNAEERVLKDSEVLIVVSKLGVSSVDIECRMFCDRVDFSSLKFEMNEKVKEAFDKVGISFAYPQQEVHVNVVPAVDHELKQRDIKEFKGFNEYKECKEGVV